MFQTFYQLREQPFGANPDPRFLYLSRAHREAFSSLLYRVQADSGFLAMVAEPGMGKTTLLFHLLRQLEPAARTAFLFQTQCTSHELLQHLLSEFECDTSITDTVRMSQELKSLLLAEANAGRRCVLIIDEAQNLERETLETIRLLSNFETPRQKLLQIILSGQGELGDMLNRAELQQLRQRLSCIVHIQRFTPEETTLYIAHRLTIAGYTGKLSQLFNLQALARIAQLSEGIPRVINNICFNALSLGFALESKQIGLGIIDEVASDLGFSSAQRFARPEQLTFRTASFVNSSGSTMVGSWDDGGDAFTAIAEACIEQDQVEVKVVTMGTRARTARMDAQSECLECGTEEQAPEADEVYALPVSASDDIFTPSVNGATNSELTSSSSETETSDAKHQTPAFLMSLSKVHNAVRNSSGLFLVRGCVCVLALCVAPTIHNRVRYSVSGQKGVDSVKENLLPSATLRPLEATELSLIPQDHGTQFPNNVEISPQIAREQLRAYFSESNSHMEYSLAKKMRNAGPSPGVVINPASYDVGQLLEPLPLNSMPVTARAIPVSSPDSDSAQRRSSQSAPLTGRDFMASYVPPRAIWRPAPTNPDATRNAISKEGVLLVLSVSSNGTVYKVDALKGSTILVAAAEGAVKQWKYSPALSNGRPIDSQVFVSFQF